MSNTKKYAAIGYVVSKVVLPLARKQAKKAAKTKARSAATSLTHSPAKMSVLAGTVIGAAAWMIARSRDRDGDEA
ncbi:MAG: hypothetical protein H7287_02175 [Thermoleophilia bacterium]|nr:hypothetical protein [Thermoleophilia bacterium]